MPPVSRNRQRRGSPQSGVTLVELMVATTIAALLIAGTLRLFVQFRAAWQSAENLAELEERAAFALTALEHDIRLAGFRGRQEDPEPAAMIAGMSAQCAGRDVSAWALALTEPVAGSDGLYSLPCPAFTGAVTNSDTLIIRHARAEPTKSVSEPAVQAHAWYLDRSSSEAAVPSLRRYALVSGGLMQNQEIVPGVTDFQVELGVDRDGDSIIDGFVTPDSAAGQHVMAVRLRLVVRSTHREPGNGSGRQQQSAERTVWLRNPVTGG